MPLDTFLDKCRHVMRSQRLSSRTKDSYVGVIRRTFEYHGGRTHNHDLSAEHVRAYLSPLAAERARHPQPFCLAAPSPDPFAMQPGSRT